MHRPARSRSAGTLSAALLLVAVLSGCTYAKQEPGLFRTPQPSRTQQTSNTDDGRFMPLPTNRRLPVLGEATWTTADGLAVSSRYAAHGLRRIPGATVLDYSITPLSAPGLRRGDRVGDQVNLGLTRGGGPDVNILLLDSPRRLAYRPLVHRESRQFNRCLCTPLWRAQRTMRIGETRMLQAVFPEVPTAVVALDVSMVMLPPFWRVPLTSVDAVPRALPGGTDLSRPLENRPALTTPVTFSPDATPRREQSIQIDQVVAADHLVSMQWTITSLTPQTAGARLVAAAPPVSATLPRGILATNPQSASGPRLRTNGKASAESRSLWMTTKGSGFGFIECLCTDIDLWASALAEEGGQATVVTHYPAGPAETSTVDVVLPGLTTLTSLSVTQGREPPTTGEEVRGSSLGEWTYDPSNPPAGWSTVDWPTPLPGRHQLSDYRQIVDDIITMPT